MTPPRIVTWLLESFGCDPNNEAIVGDLVEQLRLGRSRMSYRGQVLRALVVGIYAQLCERPFVSLSGATSGVALAAVLSALLRRVLLPYAVIGPLSYRAFDVVLCVACAASVHLTLSVARFFQRQGHAFVLLYLAVFSPALCICWLDIVIRFHDAQTTRGIVLGVLLNYAWIITTLTTTGVGSFSRRERQRDSL